MESLGPYQLDQVYCADFREFCDALPDQSIDLIFTDPPYSKRYLGLYTNLAEQAARILKPTGFLMTYASTYWKDQVMFRLVWRLEYFWDVSIFTNRDAPVLWQRKMIARAKPLLIYRPTAGTGMPRYNALGLWQPRNAEKSRHRWQQDISTPLYYIDAFTPTDALIFDPMVGSGTTARACQILKRRFLACDIDPEAVEIASEFLASPLPPEDAPGNQLQWKLE